MDPTRDKTRRGPRTIDVQARAERTARRHVERLRPAYAHLIELGQHGYGVAHAERMVQRILEVRAQGGWTGSERTSLAQALAKWRRRAEGLDARYLVLGSNQTAPPKGQAARQAIKDLQVVLQVGAEVRSLIQEALAGLAEDEEGGAPDAR